MDMAAWRDIALTLLIALIGSGGGIAYLRLRPDVNKIKAETNLIILEAQRAAKDILTDTAQQASDANRAASDVTKAAAEAWKLLVTTQGETITGLQARLKEKIAQMEELQVQLNEVNRQLMDCNKRRTGGRKNAQAS